MKNRFVSLIFPLMLVLDACSFNNSKVNGNLYIAQKAYQTVFNVGEAFNHEGLKIIATPSGLEVNDYQLNIQDDYVFIAEDTGELTVNVTHPSYNPVYYTIEVTNIPYLEVASMPNKTTYYVGEYFSSEGLVVKANEEVVNSYTLSLQENYLFEEEGEYNIEVSKNGYFSTHFKLNVLPAHALKIKSLPSRTIFTQGDAFSLQGLVVVDEYENLVTDYQTSIKAGEILKKAGEHTVIVEKDEYKSTSFGIRVIEKETPEKEYKELHIYYINDTHGAYIRQTPPTSMNEAGISYIGQYIIDEVASNTSKGEYSVVLSGGDMFQGGYESNLTHGDIMIDAMNIIGFDAMVLGNHEFDWGEEYLEGFASKLNCPIISSNTFYSYASIRPTYLKPYTIIERDDLKIGIIGGAQKNLGSSISGSISSNFSFPAPNEYIKYYSDELRMSYNCDIVIAAFHDGGYDVDDESEPTKFDDITQVSPESECRYVDAMFFAHDHYAKRGTYNGVPYMESGCNGRYVGVMDFTLEYDTVSYSIDSVDSVNHRAYNSCQDDNDDITALADKYRDIIGDPDEIICYFEHSYESDDFTNVVCLAMYWYVNEHKEDFGDEEVYFASHNTGGVRSDVNSGAFTMRDLYKVFPFDNCLCIQTCTERNIRNMENSSYYCTYKSPDITYDYDGYTKAVSITYICEYKDAYKYQTSYVKYEATAKDALLAYLRSGVNTDL